MALICLLALPGAYRLAVALWGDFPGSPELVRAADPPHHLFSFTGSRLDPLQRPIGVLADEDGIYVVDSARHTIDVFEADGTYRSSFGTTETAVPLYIARSPLDGDLYVSDRSAGTVHVFDPSGEYAGPFESTTSSETTRADTPSFEWAPVALAFGDDGSLYATDVLAAHRLIKFAPDGTLERSVGGTGTVERADESPGVFSFPNGLAVHGGFVYVADSNNRRVQVFDADLKHVRTVVTQGLPRGIDFLSGESTATDDARYVVVDTLSNDASIRSTSDGQVLRFGREGTTALNYPNGVAVLEPDNVIYIADTGRGRIQAWGWAPIAEETAGADAGILIAVGLSLLPLLPLPLLLAPRRVFATADFIERIATSAHVGLLSSRRVLWLVTPADHTLLVDAFADSGFVDRLRPVEPGTLDAEAAGERMALEPDLAALLLSAARADLFATDNADLAELAREQGIEVVDSDGYVSRFGKHVVESGPLG